MASSLRAVANTLQLFSAKALQSAAPIPPSEQPVITTTGWLSSRLSSLYMKASEPGFCSNSTAVTAHATKPEAMKSNGSTRSRRILLRSQRCQRPDATLAIHGRISDHLSSECSCALVCACALTGRSAALIAAQAAHPKKETERSGSFLTPE